MGSSPVAGVGSKPTGQGGPRLVRGPEPYVDVGDYLLGPTPADPALVPAAVALFVNAPDQDAVALWGREDAHHLVVTTSGPHHAIGAVVFDADDGVPALHEHFAGHHHHAVHRNDVDILGRFGIHHLRARIDSRCTRRESENEHE